MKKVFMLAALVAALASCQSNKKGEINEVDIFAADSAGIEEITEVFQGTLPSADGKNINYILTLNADIDGPDTLFSLDMIYLDSIDSKKNQTFNAVGKQQKIHKKVNHQHKTAYKLTPDNGERPIYFLLVNDTTLRMVDNHLNENPMSDLNYDILLVSD